jgi:hypothetical protein
MVAALSSETMVSYHSTTRRHSRSRRPQLESSPPRRPQISHRFLFVLKSIDDGRVSSYADATAGGRSATSSYFKS